MRAWVSGVMRGLGGWRDLAALHRRCVVTYSVYLRFGLLKWSVYLKTKCKYFTSFLTSFLTSIRCTLKPDVAAWVECCDLFPRCTSEYLPT